MEEETAELRAETAAGEAAEQMAELVAESPAEEVSERAAEREREGADCQCFPLSEPLARARAELCRVSPLLHSPCNDLLELGAEDEYGNVGHPHRPNKLRKDRVRR